MATHQLLVEVIVDNTQLESTIDLLARMGQVDAKTAADFKKANAEINKQSAAIKATAAAAIPLKKSIEDVNRVTKSMTSSFMQGFEEGIIETLKEAGVSLDEFLAAMKNGPQSTAAGTESLRQRLRNLTQQLGELKLSGQDNTEQFKQLREEAAKIQDAMADAGQEIRNVASDTGVFDGLIGAAQGIAGGFAVAQGTAALFEGESEELQKTLLKVNAAMAILQGLQQVQNVLQKESAAATLGDTVAKNFNILATKLYTAVTGRATQATVGFKLALAATGIGLLVIGVIAAVQAFKEFAIGADDAAEAQERLNNAIGIANKALAESNEIYVQAISQQKIALEEQLALAEARGESETNLLKIRQQIAREEADIGKKSLENLELTRIGVERLQNKYDDLIGEIATYNKIGENEQVRENTERTTQATAKLVKELESQRDAIKPLLDAGVQAVEQIDNAQKKSALLSIALQKEAQRIQRENLLARLNDELAALERKLLATVEGSEQELRLTQQVANKKLQIELTNETLTKNQRLLIREQTLKENLEIERAYNERLLQESIEAQISRNNAVLNNIKTSDDEKLLLTISNLELTAALEINAAKDNSAKIKEINAERDAQIAAARKASIEQQAQQEIDMINAVSGADNRALDRIANDENKAASLRISAIRQRAEFDLTTIDIREQALEEQLRRGLVSEREYNVAHERLQDEKAQVAERTEEKITAIHESEAEKRKRIQRENVDFALQTTQEVLSLLDGINDIRAERDQQRVDAERARVEELLEAGAITEQEAIKRNKRIDAEEKKSKREAAQRDKQLAIFNSIIATAQGVVRALAVPPAPNFVLAAIMGALGAAQTAIIAARPIPKFRTGKEKGRYQGPGIIGEAGSEILERNGQMYLAQKETLVWLGKEDKVYTPTETKQMLPGVNRELMKQQPPEFINSEKFANTVGEIVAVALAKEIKKLPQSNITIDNDGFMMHIKEGLSKTNYRDKYYSFK